MATTDRAQRTNTDDKTLITADLRVTVTVCLLKALIIIIIIIIIIGQKREAEEEKERDESTKMLCSSNAERPL
jgi:hypothetical protein